jgi:hypothetical protein
MFLVSAQWQKNSSLKTTNANRNDKFVIIKVAIVWWAKLFESKLPKYVAFFSDKVEDFLKKYDYKNNPKQHNDPFIITEYDRVIQNIVKVWFTFKRNLLILSKNVTIKFEEVLLYLVQMKGIDFFIEFCSSSKLIKSCRYDAQNALNNLSIQELSFYVTWVFPL